MSLHIKNYHGAGVLLFRYNKEKETFEVLLGKRSIRQGYGKWAIPGGGLERKDGDFNYRACAYRELWEETGLDITILQKNPSLSPPPKSRSSTGEPSWS